MMIRGTAKANSVRACSLLLASMATIASAWAQDHARSPIAQPIAQEWQIAQNACNGAAPDDLRIFLNRSVVVPDLQAAKITATKPNAWLIPLTDFAIALSRDGRVGPAAALLDAAAERLRTQRLKLSETDRVGNFLGMVKVAETRKKAGFDVAARHAFKALAELARTLPALSFRSAESERSQGLAQVAAGARAAGFEDMATIYFAEAVSVVAKAAGTAEAGDQTDDRVNDLRAIARSQIQGKDQGNNKVAATKLYRRAVELAWKIPVKSGDRFAAHDRLSGLYYSAIGLAEAAGPNAGLQVARRIFDPGHRAWLLADLSAKYSSRGEAKKSRDTANESLEVLSLVPHLGDWRTFQVQQVIMHLSKAGHPNMALRASVHLHDARVIGTDNPVSLIEEAYQPIMRGYAALGEMTRAKALLSSIPLTSARYPKAVLQIATGLVESGALDKARKYYDETIAALPLSERPSGLPTFEAELSIRINKLVETGAFSSALDTASQIRALQPRATAIRQILHAMASANLRHNARSYLCGLSKALHNEADELFAEPTILILLYRLLTDKSEQWD
ncbi:MAG: hypothetical protein K0U74_15255 [Alphaproteobacteria bacterium]|nr:hypothetical protein [Alphaproteobacteria bacterium]